MNKHGPFINIGPGDVIKDDLVARNWTQEDLATVMGVSPKLVNDLVNNKVAVTHDSARLLCKAFGQSPQFWMNLDANYRIRLHEEMQGERDAELRAMIFKYMPIKEMMTKRWISGFKTTKELLDIVKAYWQVREIDQDFFEGIQALPAFKRSAAYGQFESYYARVWYQMAKKSSAPFKVGTYDRAGVQEIADNYHAYTVDDGGVERVLADLNVAGVKFLVLSHIQKTYVDGASFWDRSNPVIACTCRHDRVDNFWFTVAHEIAHILKHFSDKDAMFIDNIDEAGSKKEVEANELASDMIRSREILAWFRKYHAYISHDRVERCAKEVEVGEAVIVGVLQHNKVLSPRNLNRLKEKVTPLLPRKYRVEAGVDNGE